MYFPLKYRLHSFIAVAPSAPVNPVVSGTPTTTAITLAWTVSATAAVPAETYTVFCMPSTETTCDIAQKVGTSSAVDVPRSTLTGTVSGLTAGTTYKCCLRAKNTVDTTYNASPTSVSTVGKYIIIVSKIWKSNFLIFPSQFFLCWFILTILL